MNISIIGNCQARPVATFLAAICPGLSIHPAVVVHLETDDSSEKNFKNFENSELIFTQPIMDNHPVKHLRNCELADRFRDKMVIWPNIFFTGQCPDVVCIATEKQNRVLGPLDTYHQKDILNCWLNETSAADCVKALDNQRIDDEAVSLLVDISMKELQSRERNLDVTISDYIAENWLRQRLFYVFNHPSSNLLFEICVRLARFCDLQTTNTLISDFYPEPLNRVIPPTLPAIKKALQFSFPTSSSSKGFELDVRENGISLGNARILSLPELVEQSYVAYDHQLIRGAPMRITPGYLAGELAIQKAA